MAWQTDDELFNLLSRNGPNEPMHWAAKAELERRQYEAQKALNEAQFDAAKAQVDAIEFAKQNLDQMRNTARWTMIAALGTLAAAAASWLMPLFRS
jgi:hypothetical protein